MTRRSANGEMIRGFMDGYDLTSPEPSSNRTASYRHGFMCARIDKSQIASPGYETLNRMANEAMDSDNIAELQ